MNRWIRYLLALLTYAVYSSFMKVEDLLGNYLVGDQLNGGDIGYIVWRFYRHFRNYLFWLVLIIIIGLLWEEIKRIFLFILRLIERRVKITGG